MNKNNINEILELHKKWLNNEQGGVRADLSGANLYKADLSAVNLSRANLTGAYLRKAYIREADLREADLRKADLRKANLTGAYIREADLRKANLTGAYIREADLTGAYLREADLRKADLGEAKIDKIKDDLFDILSKSKTEVKGLYKSLLEGRIEGTVYEGECACLVGTIANLRSEKFNDLTNGITPYSERPIEKWFLAIQKGDIPENNQISNITKGWIEEFARENNINLKGE